MAKLIIQRHQDGTIVGIAVQSFPIFFKKRERNWFAYSPNFRTIGYSSVSQSEAEKDLNKALDVFFQVHLSRGTVEQALVELDWSRDGESFNKSQDVPYYLLGDKKVQSYAYSQ